MSDHQYTSTSDLLTQLPNQPGSVGLDLEADSLYRYSERICLVQVCYGDEVKLVDPLADQSMDELVAWIGKSKIWMHGADYDMSLMLREWNLVPPLLYDTQIAAQLLGHERFGYASLVEQYFGVELSKSSQKADWGKRPLSSKMLEYAKNDVRYLLPLAEAVEGKLRELGRYDWFLQSCEASMDRVVAREAQPKEAWRIAGSGKLKLSGLRYLKALWEWRDGEASAWNRPSFMVASNKQLISWAIDLFEGRKISLPPKLRPDRQQRLMKFIADAREIPESEWPQKIRGERHRYDETFEERLKVKLDKRNVIAGQLGLDPSIIASRAVVEQITRGGAQAEEILLPWQAELLDF